MNHWITWALGVPVILCNVAAQAAPQSSIEEVIVSASPHGKSAKELAGAISVLSGGDLQRSAAATLGDTLKDQLGVNNSSFGPGVGVPVIRGLSGNRLEILQNGSPLADASATSPDHAIAQEPLLADRIEILRGPASLRFGPGAIGGVVNIIDNRIHLESFSGSEGAIETRHDFNSDDSVVVGRLDAGNGLYSGHLSGMARDANATEIPGAAALDVDDPADTSHGYIANSEMEADSFSAGVSRTTDKLVVGLGISRVKNDYGIPPGAHHHEEHDDHDHDHDEHEEEEHEDGHEDETLDEFVRIGMEQTEYSGKLLMPSLSGLFSTLSLDLSHTDYEHTEFEFSGGARAAGTRYETDTDHARLELTFGSEGDWQGYTGAQYSQTAFLSVGDEAFVPANDTELAGLFGTLERPIGEGTLEFGLRLDRQRAELKGGDSQSHNLLNASASYLHALNDAHSVGIVYTHAQRAPSAEELFALGEHVATGLYQVGDTELDRESSNNLELTWRYSGAVDINASLYHREFRDFIYSALNGTALSHHLADEGASGAATCSADIIDFDNHEEELADALPCAFTRQEDARFTGAEAELSMAVGDYWQLRLWGDLVNAQLKDDGDVPRLPPARLGADVDYNWNIWSAGLSFTHAFEQNNPGDFETATDSYQRLDAHVSLDKNHWRLFLKASNLTDEEIRNATSFLRDLAPEPGRSLVIGARYSF